VSAPSTFDYSSELQYLLLLIKLVTAKGGGQACHAKTGTPVGGFKRRKATWVAEGNK